MFGGYTEVAAYYVDPDPSSAGGYLDQIPLPEDYVPQFKAPDPWHQKSAIDEDFILIAEFSEQEGPRPLITIPTNSCASTRRGFDLNDFSVRLMSVDYQTAAGNSFSLCEDSYVVVSETKFKIYAYVHYFTLYDSQARGFVRPFCMAYVTPDHSKLIASHEEMASEFNKVSHCFKYGNLLLFVKDMTHYLSDLMFTRERFAEFQVLKEREEKEEDDVGDMFLMDVGSDPNEESILSSLTDAGLKTAIQEVQNILDTTTVLMNDREMEQRFRTLEQKAKREEEEEPSVENFQYSCSLRSESGNSWSGSEQSRRPSSASELTDSWNLDNMEMYKPKVVRANHKKHFDKSLRTLHELCRWGAKEGLSRLRGIHRYFSRDMTTLHIERHDAASIDPSSGLLTIGRNVQLNFLSGSSISTTAHKEITSPCSLVSSPSGKLTARWLSSDTLASFHSAESFLSCSEGASSDESKHNASEFTNDVEDIEVASCASAFSSEFTVVRPNSLDIHTAVQFPSIPVISSADHIANLTSKSAGHGFLTFAQKYSITPHLLFSLLCGRPTVIIGSSKMEADVRAIISALCIFVPGHSSFSQSVCSWLTRPLKLTDLSKFCLIGLGRERKGSDQMVPNSLKNYVSILNLETKTLLCPSYQGGVLTEIYKKRKTFKGEKPYLAFIHSILYDLSHKALFYYHAFSTSENAAVSEITQSITTAERGRYQKLSSKFCSKLCLAECDIKIVQYLVEIVENQQIKDMSKDSTGTAAPTIKLDPCKCTAFTI